MTMWRYGFILPLAGGITLGLAMIMKASVAAEFVPQPTDSAGLFGAAYVAEIICDCMEGRIAMTLQRDLYMHVSAPPRLEPDKRCKVDFGIYIIPEISSSGYIGFLRLQASDPKRAKALEAARKKAAEEKLKDPCPLVLKPNPNPRTN